MPAKTIQQKTNPGLPSDTVLTIIFGAVAAFLGTIGIIGLFFNIVFLSAVLPEFKPIGISAAIAWIFFGLMLVILAKKPLTGVKLTVVTACLVVIAITAAIDLSLKLLGSSFLFEDLVNGIATRIMSGQITQVSPVASFFILLSAAGMFILLNSSRYLLHNQKARDISGISGFLIAFMSFTVLLSYGFGAPFLYKTTAIPISLTSVLAALFTGLGLITSAGSSSLPLRYLTGPTVRSRLLRSFLPLIVIIVLTQGLLQSSLISIWQIDNAIQVAIGLMLFCLITIFVVSKAAGDVSHLIENEEEKRRKAEGLQHESEETFRALAENANDGILVAVGTGIYVFANKRAAEITGYTVDELMNLSIKDLTHPDEFTKKVNERYTGILNGEPPESQYETTIIHKDGKNVPIEVTSAKTDWKGQSADLVIIRDISTRKQAEAALRETNEYLRNLLDYANAPIIVWDPAFRITRFNHAFEHLTGQIRTGSRRPASGHPLPGNEQGGFFRTDTKNSFWRAVGSCGNPDQACFRRDEDRALELGKHR